MYCLWQVVKTPKNILNNPVYTQKFVDSSRNVLAYGGARAGNWRGNWWMEWVASTLHTTSERGVSSITTADAHTSAASSRVNWRPRRFKWTGPFRRKTKSGFCACAITFHTQSTCCAFRLTEFHLNPANRQSTKKHNAYQLLYIYGIPADDGLQICSKHVEVDWWNKVRINSASSWFLLHRCIEMHLQQNV